MYLKVKYIPFLGTYFQYLNGFCFFADIQVYIQEFSDVDIKDYLVEHFCRM